MKTTSTVSTFHYVASLLFLGLAFYALPTPSLAAIPASAPKMSNGYAVDWCLHWGAECGKPAADQYCRLSGYPAGAANFTTAYMFPTWVLGDNKPCNINQCAGFSMIQCAASPAPAAPAPAAPPPGPAAPGEIDGWTYNIYDTRSRMLTYYQSPSVSACRSNCQTNAQCTAYSWVKPGGYRAGDPSMCYLMAATGPMVRHNCCISGTKSSAGPVVTGGGSTGGSTGGSSGNLTGTWGLTTTCTYTPPTWSATVQLSQGAGGALTASTSDDSLNAGFQLPEPAPGAWGTKVISRVSGSQFNLALRPKGWLSVLEFTGTVNGSRIDGRIHHYTTDDCNFTMVRK